MLNPVSYMFLVTSSGFNVRWLWDNRWKSLNSDFVPMCIYSTRCVFLRFRFINWWHNQKCYDSTVNMKSTLWIIEMFMLIVHFLAINHPARFQVLIRFIWILLCSLSLYIVGFITCSYLRVFRIEINITPSWCL